MFCKLFSESSTGHLAILKLPCCPSKQKGNFQKTYYKTFKTSGRPTQYMYCVHDQMDHPVHIHMYDEKRTDLSLSRSATRAAPNGASRASRARRCRWSSADTRDTRFKVNNIFFSKTIELLGNHVRERQQASIFREV